MSFPWHVLTQHLRSGDKVSRNFVRKKLYWKTSLQQHHQCVGGEIEAIEANQIAFQAFSFDGILRAPRQRKKNLSSSRGLPVVGNSTPGWLIEIQDRAKLFCFPRQSSGHSKSRLTKVCWIKKNFFEWSFAFMTSEHQFVIKHTWGWVTGPGTGWCISEFVFPRWSLAKTMWPSVLHDQLAHGQRNWFSTIRANERVFKPKICANFPASRESG